MDSDTYSISIVMALLQHVEFEMKQWGYCMNSAQQDKDPKQNRKGNQGALRPDTGMFLTGQVSLTETCWKTDKEVPKTTKNKMETVQV